jgi:glutathione synthase/RimK-type ligase-like ATP-grasp enzyme
MIGIHDRPGSFSDRWIMYCQKNNVSFRIVDCLASDVMQQCEELDGVLWHWSHADPSATLVARSIITSLETKGVLVFPNANNCWHFDDKVAQKYLLEAINAPLIPTWVFLDQNKAMEWINETTWPKVFKLRCGAGSHNVKLIRNRSEAKALCKKAFQGGFPTINGYFSDMQTRLNNTRTLKKFWDKVRRAPTVFLNNYAIRQQMPRQKGYLYFQEFLPENAFDTRITIIGDRAFGFVRANRPNDFRASGSGSIFYEKDKVDIRCVDIAFNVTKILGTQSLAFDFLFDAQNEPMIGEISYCYKPAAVNECRGYWDHMMIWHEGHTWPEEAIVDDLLAALENNSRDTND